MGFRFVGSSFRNGKVEYTSKDNEVEYTSSFSITNFTIKKVLECTTKDGTDYCMLWINYPEAKNYNGNKILVYQNKRSDILALKELDPHFLEEGISPIARFEPTARGWTWGRNFLARLLMTT